MIELNFDNLVTFGKDNPFEDIYIMAYRLYAHIHTGLVSFVYQYAWPCSRVESTSADGTHCDSLGILCFTRVLNLSSFERTKIYLVRALVFSYTIVNGPYLPQHILMGNVIPYEIGYGHFVSLNIDALE